MLPNFRNPATRMVGTMLSVLLNSINSVKFKFLILEFLRMFEGDCREKKWNHAITVNYRAEFKAFESTNWSERLKVTPVSLTPQFFWLNSRSEIYQSVLTLFWVAGQWGSDFSYYMNFLTSTTRFIEKITQQMKNQTTEANNRAWGQKINQIHRTFKTDAQLSFEIQDEVPGMCHTPAMFQGVCSDNWGASNFSAETEQMVKEHGDRWIKTNSKRLIELDWKALCTVQPHTEHRRSIRWSKTWSVLWLQGFRAQGLGFWNPLYKTEPQNILSSKSEV